MKKNKLLTIGFVALISALLFMPHAFALLAEEFDEVVDICHSQSALKVIYMGKVIFTIITYAVPFVLIVMMSLDVYKLVQSPDDKGKVFPAIKNRLIAALLVFFIPTIISLVLSVLGDSTDISECYNNADPSIYESFNH